MSEEYDPFDTDDSNAIGDYRGRVVSAEFGTNDDYDTETLLLKWELEITGPDDFPFETRSVNFTCGKTFETPDGGKTALHESGKPKGFNTQSRIGFLIHRCFHTADSKKPAPFVLDGHADNGEGDEIEPFGLREHFAAIGMFPHEAAAWVGIEFDIHEESVDYGTINGTHVGVKTFEMPFAVVSLPGATKAKAKKGAAKKGTARTRKPKAEAAPTANWDAIKELVLDAGESVDDHDAFVKAGNAIVAEQGVAESEGHAAFEVWLTDEEAGGWSAYAE